MDPLYSMRHQSFKSSCVLLLYPAALDQWVGSCYIGQVRLLAMNTCL